MPSVKDQSTAEAIAREYCSNGRNKEQGMRTIGYAESSCQSGKAVGDVYGNLRVKAAIAQIDAKTAQETGYSVECYRQELEKARARAQSLKQPSAEVSAIVAKGRSCGYDKDNDMGSKEAAIALSPEQAERYSRMAAAATAERLEGPRLAKETA